MGPVDAQIAKDKTPAVARYKGFSFDHLDAAMDSSTVLLTISICILVFSIYWKDIRRTRLPPGPPRLPIIGNLLGMPKRFQWEIYHEWAKKLSVRLSFLRLWMIDIVFKRFGYYIL